MTLEDAVSTVWHYHQLGHELGEADLIWVLGSHDLRVADRAVELWREGRAPCILMSGGFGNLTEGVFKRPEADLLADRARQLGVPADRLLTEDCSTNTGENVLFGQRLLASAGLEVRRVIAVQKPYMERRTFATIRKQWPEIEVQVTSPRLSLEEYCTGVEGIERETVLHLMTGDLQRIWEYPRRGFMIEQEVPARVLEAWKNLVAAGYTDHLLAPGTEVLGG